MLNPIASVPIGLAGYPIAHSLSPELFRAAYATIPEVAKRYSYNLIERKSFEEVLEIIEREKYHAFNVTAPFKQEAFALAATREKCVEETEAANLLIRSETGFIAHNTDYWGVRNMLSERIKALDIRKLNALVIGCGGAGRAAAIAARDLKIDTSVSNRNNERCAAFCLSRGLSAIRFEELNEAIGEFDIIIYTLPLYTPIIEYIDKNQIVIEANYKNPSINLTGYEWLYSQALTGFLLMTGVEPDSAEMKKFLEVV